MSKDPNSTYLEKDDDYTSLLTELESYELDILDEYLDENTDIRQAEVAEIFSSKSDCKAAWQFIEILREEKLLRSELADGFY